MPNLPFLDWNLLREAVASEGQYQWANIAALSFAVVFLGIGLYRVVEFHGIGVRGWRKAGFVTFHILGCLLFAASIVVAVADAAGAHKIAMNVLFFGSLAFLFPGQIFMAFQRRQRQR